jgi:transposase
MTGKRKRYTAEFKARVALEALRGELTAAQLATKHGVHQTMIAAWKKQAVEGMASVFSGQADAQETAKSAEAEVEKLHAKIGQLLVERDFLAKASAR